MTLLADEQRPHGAPLKLWDVLNAEAHVRALAAAWLQDHHAKLDASKRENLIAYLLAEGWRISGLTADGRTTRPDALEYVAVVEISFASPRWSSVVGVMTAVVENLGPFATDELARDAGDQALLEAKAAGDVASFELLAQLGRGMYDPQRGLSFSTFSRQILSLRVVDWYRETFGDSRYGNHQLPVSLESLAAAEDETVEGFLDKHMPGAVDHHVDEWNVYVYDHVLADEAVASAAAR